MTITATRIGGLGRCCSYNCFEGSPAAAATTAAVAAGSVFATTTARIDILLCLRPLLYAELLSPCYSYITLLLCSILMHAGMCS